MTRWRWGRSVAERETLAICVLDGAALDGLAMGRSVEPLRGPAFVARQPK
jgi:hypothetical protein